MRNHNLSKKIKILYVGGGDSLFVDHLLMLGYEDITVLDISAVWRWNEKKAWKKCYKGKLDIM